jgi:hypothetical protein
LQAAGKDAIMVAAMRGVLLLAILLSSPPLGGDKSAGDFSHSYAVWVSVKNGECLYWLTDVGLDSRKLAEVLGGGDYEKQLGLEILTSGRTPDACVTGARQAAASAGFQLIRSRQATEKDRLRGIQ